MQKIRKSIEGKGQWDFLQRKLESIDGDLRDNQNDAIGKIKDLIESVAVTIVIDNGGIDENKDIGPLVKDAIRTLSFYGRIETKDQEVALKLASSFVSAFSGVGELRNRHGTTGHGQDAEHEDIDQYLFEMALECADSLGAFLIKAHHCDLHDRYRLRYEDNLDFNDYVDSTSEEIKIGDVVIVPSKALFTDIEAYKEQLQAFKDSPEALTETLTVTENIEQTVARISKISRLFDESQIESLVRVVEQQANLRKQLELLLKNIDFSHLTKVVGSMQPAIDAMEAERKRREEVIKRLGL